MKKTAFPVQKNRDLRHIYSTFIKKSTGVLLFLAISIPSFCDIYGGDITWRCIGHDSFIVTNTIYRDCNTGSIPNKPLNIYCNTTGAFIKSYQPYSSAGWDITPACNKSCTRCTDSTCAYPYGIQRYVTSKIIILSDAGSCCEIRISYSVCCRTSSYTTGGASTNYYNEAILNRCLNPCDNSMTFTNPSIAILCNGYIFAFCHGESDPDLDPNGGLIDSTTHELIAPLTSHDSGITYLAPYSAQKPVYFDGFPYDTLPFPKGFHIDNACVITFRPMIAEQTSFTQKFIEYRKINNVWTRIGEFNREFTAIVINCPVDQAPVLSGPFYKEVVASNTVTFSITTDDSDPKDSVRIYLNKTQAGAVWNTTNGQQLHATATLEWTPGRDKISKTPYDFIVSARDDHCPNPERAIDTYYVLVKDTVDGFEDISEFDLKIYPNPASNTLHISTGFSTSFQVLIFDLYGKNVLIKRFSNTSEAELTELKLLPGLYFLEIEFLTGQKIFRKLVIE